MSGPSPVPVGADRRLQVHAESYRAGIRVAVRALRGHFPQADVIEQIVGLGTQEVVLREFPITSVMAAAPERRRMYAFKAMECLLVRSGQESLLMTTEQLDKLTEMAWHIAGKMEEQDRTALQLDTLGPVGI